MQVGRVILILTEEQSENLMSILEHGLYCNHRDKTSADSIKQLLSNAKKTIIIDDYRPDKLDKLPM